MKQLSRRETLSRLGGAALCLAVGSAEAADALSIAGRPAELVLTPVSAGTLRISLLALNADGSARNIAPDPALEIQSVHSPILRTRSAARSKSVSWGRFRVRISAAPLSLTVEEHGGKTVQHFEFDSATGAVGFRNGAGPLFGLGEGGEQFDRRNQEFDMRNGQVLPDRRTDGARVPIPWLIGSEGWAIFFHQPYGKMELTGAEGRFQAEAGADILPLDLFLVVSREPAGILKQYAELTGFPQLPPLWSFGYQQSHRTLDSREEVMSEAKEFREKSLPCDTLIYLGTGFSPSGWNTGHGSFTFNQKVFPDPAKMIQELHGEHFHVILHLTRPPLKLFGTVADTGAKAEDVNDAANYWTKHRAVFALGVDGWWPDEGDTLSPESRLARNRMYWEGPLLDRPNVRPWALHRNGYAGLQRYGWLWSGDINSDWKAFAAQIPVGLNTGLTGIPYWGTDTGGFVPTKEYTGELYVRWFQFSAFTPLFRSHGRTWKLHLPWGWDTGETGPVEAPIAPDEKELHNAKVEPICKQYLDLRYRLLPYIYSLARESHDTGMPMMRAMWLHYPADPEAARQAEQYLWGRDILVAPVLEPGAASRGLYLPAGNWHDFWTGETVAGGKRIERHVDLATLPLYVRAGAIVPMGPVKQYVSEPVDKPLTIRIYGGSDGEFVMYEDDGVSFAYQHGQYMRMQMHWQDRSRQLRLSLAPGSGMYGPPEREIDVELAGGRAKKSVRFHGSPLVVQL
jgi:alpha-glucosidase (family GH31 glycosyl hydrolase)